MLFRVLFLGGPALIWLGLCLSFVSPLKLARRAEWALAGLFFFATQKFAWYALFGGDAFQPELPAAVIAATDFLYSFSCVLFGFSLVLCGWRRVANFPRGRNAGWISAVAAALAALVAAVGLHEGIRIPRVSEKTVRVAGLPRSFDGLRIVQLSDLHASPATDRARFEAIVRAVNALEPDLVCVTGDLADGSPEARAGQLAPLAGLRAKHGVFGCMGNHEIYSDYLAWKPVFASLGLRMLDDASVTITNGADRLALGGVCEPFGLDSAHGSWPANNVRRAFRGVPEGTFRILMQHRPVRAEENCAEGVGVQLSGHTHGGAVLGLDRIVAAFNEGFVRGIYGVPGREGGRTMVLHVSSGTGQWAGFPQRLGVPSEIALLVLRPLE